jgi:peptidoglycan/LPS O-acetylase OafA/YrhL
MLWRDASATYCEFCGNALNVRQRAALRFHFSSAWPNGAGAWQPDNDRRRIQKLIPPLRVGPRRGMTSDYNGEIMQAQIEVNAARAEVASRIRYRPDVDGLRAIAVLMVLAEHLDTKLTGGYIGVDVFFVISGYLISATILADMAQGRFTIAGFYERRIRRIFPALLAMLLVTTVLVYHYFLPSEVEAYAGSLLAALASGSNFLFWHKGGYFDQPDAEPLLHTWSLGVEEQFYILFPVFLVLVRRWFPRRLKAAVLGIAAASFIAACLTVRTHPIAAFFFAPLRAWELLIGTIVSQRYLPSLRGALARNLASGLGLLLVLVPGALYTSGTAGTVFPGWTALPPCLGAALIIAAGETGPSLVGSALAWRPWAFIGLISYSLYLWHWPLIVFQDTGGMIMHVAVLTRKVKVVTALVSIVIAALSWRFIEQPFRAGRFRPGRRQLFAITGFASLLLAGLAAGMLYARGMPGRFPPDALAVADYNSNHPSDFRIGTCFVTPDYTFADFRRDLCLGPDSGKPSILLAGDSHSAMLWAGFSTVFSDRNLMQVSVSDCAPLVQSARRDSENCKKMVDFLFNDYLPHHRIGVLLLQARWRAMDFPGLAATMGYAHAHGIAVVLIGPAMEYDKPEPRLLAFALRNGRAGDDLQEHLKPLPRTLDRQMAELARTQWHVPYISIFDDLCKPSCPAYAGPQAPMMFDERGHMTEDGAILLARAVRANGQLP